MRKGHRPRSKLVRLMIARLIQLHRETDPRRLCAKIGLSLTEEYCLRVWRETANSEMPHVIAALNWLNERRPEALPATEKTIRASEVSDNEADAKRTPKPRPEPPQRCDFGSLLRLSFPTLAEDSLT